MSALADPRLPFPPPAPFNVSAHLPPLSQRTRRYCTAIKDGLMVQAVSQRYRRKHVTTVLYSIMPGG